MFYINPIAKYYDIHTGHHTYEIPSKIYVFESTISEYART